MLNRKIIIECEEQSQASNAFIEFSSFLFPFNFSSGNDVEEEKMNFIIIQYNGQNIDDALMLEKDERKKEKENNAAETH